MKRKGLVLGVSAGLVVVAVAFILFSLGIVREEGRIRYEIGEPRIFEGEFIPDKPFNLTHIYATGISLIGDVIAYAGDIQERENTEYILKFFDNIDSRFFENNENNSRLWTEFSEEAELGPLVAACKSEDLNNAQYFLSTASFFGNGTDDHFRIWVHEMPIAQGIGFRGGDFPPSMLCDIDVGRRYGLRTVFHNLIYSDNKLLLTFLDPSDFKIKYFCKSIGQAWSREPKTIYQDLHWREFPIRQHLYDVAFKGANDMIYLIYTQGPSRNDPEQSDDLIFKSYNTAGTAINNGSQIDTISLLYEGINVLDREHQIHSPRIKVSGNNIYVFFSVSFMSPNAPGRYVSAYYLRSSFDGGTTWNDCKYIGKGEQTRSYNTKDFYVNGRRVVVFSNTGTIDATQVEEQESNDGGRTWTLARQILPAPISCRRHHSSISIAEIPNSEGKLVCAWYDEREPGEISCIISPDFGRTWPRQKLPLSTGLGLGSFEAAPYIFGDRNTVCILSKVNKRIQGNDRPAFFFNRITMTRINRAPQFTDNIQTVICMVGQPTTARFTAHDADGDRVTFSSPNLPPFASINRNTGVLTVRPLNNSLARLYENIIVTASDGTDTTRKMISLDVRRNETPTVTTSRPAEGEAVRLAAQSTYNLTITATDPEGQRPTIKIDAKPQRASWSSTPGNPATANFSWTPRANEIRANPYVITFNISDGINTVRIVKRITVIRK